MQIIAIFAKNNITLSAIDTSLLSEVDSKYVEVALIQDFKLLL